MINQIWSCNFESRYLLQDQTTLKSARLNLLIGANNSGKSHFIRELFIANTNSLQYLDNTLGMSFEKFHKLTLHKLHPIRPNISYNVGGSQFQFLDASPEAFISPKTENEWMTGIEQIASIANVIANNVGDYALQNFYRKDFFEIQKVLQELIPDEQSLIKDNWKIPNRIYIPILRGLRPLHNALNSSELDELSSQETRSTQDSNTNHCTRFQHRTIFDYFSYRNTSGSPTLMQFFDDVKRRVYTGHNLFEIFISNLLGSPEGRTRVGQYEDLLSNYFFEGQEVTIIPEYKKDQIAVKIGASEQRPIAQLGDGLQQIIIITSTIFFQTEPTLFFIEEPENSLHPWLLRRLATFMLDQSDHQYFITTHSNHLLDIAELNDDVSIYKFSKKKGAEQFEIKDAKGDREILLELGVHASSLYLANCSIWVEGVTDRLYFAFYMRKYIDWLESKAIEQNDQKILEKFKRYKTFALNHHYIFIEYGGINMVHWQFDETNIDLDKIQALKQSASPFLICDEDAVKKGERESIFKEQLGSNFYYLSAKEVENLIPGKLLIKQAQKKLKASNQPDHVKTALDDIDLPQNYFFRSTGIGRLLDEQITNKGISDFTGYFSEPSGTIKDKTKFTKDMISLMSANFDTTIHLTDHIKDLCEKIYQHIDENNP